MPKTAEELGAKLYPDAQPVAAEDLVALHQIAETPIAERPADVAAVNTELKALGVWDADARGLLNRVASAINTPRDNRQALAAHAHAEKTMAQMDFGWPAERDAMRAWLQKSAPGVLRLLVDSGAANNVDTLLELRGAYRRAKAAGK